MWLGKNYNTKNVNQNQRKHFDNYEAVTFSIHGLATEILEYTPGKVFSSWQGLAPQAVTPTLKCIHGDIPCIDCHSRNSLWLKDIAQISLIEFIYHSVKERANIVIKIT